MASWSRELNMLRGIIIVKDGYSFPGQRSPESTQSLQVLYGALNNPPQLTGWKSSGGDPCGESWMGVKCDGSAVVSLEISGLGLNGSMGYLLSNLMSLKTMDLSNNKIHDTIPFQMPPNLKTLNLAQNNLSGNLPYSISNMVSLTYLNVSGNSLTQQIADVFSNHTALGTIRKSSKMPQWTKLDCTRQPGTTECGYYIMRYMVEIVTSPNSIRSLSELFQDTTSYSQDEIDEVRDLWADYFLNN